MGKRATAVAAGGYVRRYSDKYAGCAPWQPGDGVAHGVVHLPSRQAFVAYMRACQREKLIAHWVWYVAGEATVSMRRTQLRACPADLRDAVTARLGDLV